LLVRGQWFCPGTLASSTTKTGLHDIAEILLKVALNSKNQNQSYLHYLCLLGNSVVQHILCCVFALFIFVYVDSFFGFSIVSLISRCNYLTDDTDVALTKLRETYSYWYVLKWTSDLIDEQQSYSLPNHKFLQQTTSTTVYTKYIYNHGSKAFWWMTPMYHENITEQSRLLLNSSLFWIYHFWLPLMHSVTFIRHY
jgi:hypothetical protein